MHRCATGKHRGDTLMENAANVLAITQLIVDERDPGWEMLAPLLSCARDLWPRKCEAEPWPTECWPANWVTDEPCQMWTLHIAEQGWERVSESYRGLMAYVREAAPYLCEGA